MEDYTSDEAPQSEEEEFDEIEEYNSHNTSLIREIIIIKPENRRTSNIMNLFEMTEYVSIRAVQIAKYNNCMVDTTGLSDTVLMAKRELMMRRCPLTLRRCVGTYGEKTYFEHWDPAEMTFSTSYPEAIL
jgi:hypothetical protein